MLPWRESGATVLTVKEAEGGGLDLEHLEQLLKEHAGAALKIGAFSAASNLTGIVTTTTAATRLLHAHGAYVLRMF
jgi:selenocysteine lyase/cysteine desulfurase